MSVTVVTDKGTFKGRKLESCIRTNFGEKAFYVPDEGMNRVGFVRVGDSPNHELVATVIRVVERQPYVAPPSRQSRWNDAVSEMRDAISEATDIEEEKDAHESAEEEGESEFDEEDAQSRLDDATAKWEDGVSELEDLQCEYQEWFDNLPEAFQYNSSVGEKLQAIIDLSFERVEFILESVSGDLSEAEGYVSEYEEVDLPLGFGRD